MQYSAKSLRNIQCCNKVFTIIMKNGQYVSHINKITSSKGFVKPMFVVREAFTAFSGLQYYQLSVDSNALKIGSQSYGL